MKESVIYPYPFPCYLVDKEIFAEKVKSDKSWIKDYSKIMCESYPIGLEDLVDKMYVLIRVAVKNQQRIYFNWDDMAMYVQEVL